MDVENIMCYNNKERSVLLFAVRTLETLFKHVSNYTNYKHRRHSQDIKHDQNIFQTMMQNNVAMFESNNLTDLSLRLTGPRSGYWSQGLRTVLL